jgi:phage-related protein
MPATRSFDWVESPSTSYKPKPLVTSTQFGDGYAQRAPAGLHDLQQVWDVVITGADISIADEIEAFLVDGLGHKPFMWVPPRQSVARQFICTGYQRSLTSVVGEHNVSATFEEDFTP